MVSMMVSVALCLLCLQVYTGVEGYELTILHTNDVHARIDEINLNATECTQIQRNSRQCFGGVARLKTKVDEIRRTERNVLLVDAGDQFQGSLWFYYFGDKWVEFMNLIGYNAMGLGNHEFDRGVDEVISFVRDANFQVVSSNIDTSQLPANQNLNLPKYIILSVGGERIGIVGYITPLTVNISRPGKVEFLPEIPAIQDAVNELKRANVTKIIALGHSGYQMDKRVAQGVDGIDVIVGGHSETFLYNGTSPSIEKAEGPYPTVLQSASGEPVLVVQAYAFGKYLGRLVVDFDDRGVVRSWEGQPILLDSTVPEDRSVLQAKVSYSNRLQTMTRQVIGRSHVHLDGTADKCRSMECNLGNLLTDAMVRQNMQQINPNSWTDIGIAILNGGGIRRSIAPGDITAANAINVLPFRHEVDMLELTGQTLLDMLEYCATQWTPSGSGSLFGGFLQVSGLKITYDMRKAENQRVASAQAICIECQVPEYRDVEKDKVYRVLMPDFLADGMDGYEVIKNNTVNRYEIGKIDANILLRYVQGLGPQNPIITGLEGRIRFLDDHNDPPPQNLTSTPPTCDSASALTSTTNLTFLTVLFVLAYLTVTRHL